MEPNYIDKFFYIDLSERVIYFFKKDDILSISKNYLSFPIGEINQNQQNTYTFDEFMYMAKEFVSEEYLFELRKLTDLMTIDFQKISKGEVRIIANQEVESLSERLNNEFKDNLFASLTLSVLSATYKDQLDTILNSDVLSAVFRNGNSVLLDEIFHILTIQATQEIKRIFFKYTSPILDLVKYSNNGFQTIPNKIKLVSGWNILDFNRQIPSKTFHSLNESTESLILFFLSSLFIEHLRMFTCKHCGKSYFEIEDKGCCKNKECQNSEAEERKKKIRRNFREKRKTNPYKYLIDNFGTYVRQYKHSLILKKVPESIIDLFEQEKSLYQHNVNLEISYYQKNEKPIDEDLLKYIAINKEHIKRLFLNLSKNNKEVEQDGSLG